MRRFDRQPGRETGVRCAVRCGTRLVSDEPAAQGAAGHLRGTSVARSAGQLCNLMLSMRIRLPVAASIALAAICSPGRAVAQASAKPPAPRSVATRADFDQTSVRVDSATYVRYFQRALLPGPGGALVDTTSSAPLYEYAAVRVDGLDTPWKRDSVDVELAGWANVNLGDTEGGIRADGDLSIVSVRQRLGPAYVMVGRQLRLGGAARFTRFDGVSVGARAPFGLGADVYGGWSVLPRWSQLPGYHLLGSASDTLLRNPEALPPTSRDGYWLAGGRAYYAYRTKAELGMSFHEQREAGNLGRRDVAADLRLSPWEVASLTGQATVDADSSFLSDARGVLEVAPISSVSVTGEYLHTDPSLFLSRQSLFSVFATNAFDEAGGTVTWRPAFAPQLQLAAGGFVELFGDGDLGFRTNGRLRYSMRRDRLVGQVAYSRVRETQNGYHGGRISLGIRPIDQAILSVEGYLYAYDEAIRGASSSLVGAANAEWSPSQLFSLLVGGSVARTPYASVDAQGLLRVLIHVETRAGDRR